VAGLDDVRGFQTFKGLNRKEPPSRVSIPVYLSQECLDQVSKQFPWLFPGKEPPVRKHDGPVVKRDVAALDVNVIEDYKPFDAVGLDIVPLPVWHGDDLVSLGFSFSIRGLDGDRTNVVYISDISRMIPETLVYIQNQLPPTDLLIVDTLLPEFAHPVHFNLEQATNLSKEIAAKRTYLIGMSCDAFPTHDVMNDQLAKEHGTIQFAHDGLVLYL
jgi:phosphoribosyl 1,2-cyclic phosphodiesterase